MLCAILMGLTTGCASRSQEPFARIRADISVQKGINKLDADKLDEALTEFQKAVELNPKLALAHSNIGTIYKRKGDFTAAAKAFAEAVKINHFNFDDSFSLAQMYHKLARFADAVRAYLHACELDPKNYKARLNLGVCYHQAEEMENAIACYTKATEIDSQQPAAYTNLGAAYDSQGNYYQAIHAYNEALERDPNQPMVLVNLATTLMKQERFVNARQALMKATEFDPKLSAAYERLGYCHFRMRNYSDALANYEWANTLDSKNPDVQAGLGVVRMAIYLQDQNKLKMRQLAIEHWHRSLELNPNQPKIHNLVTKYQIPQDQTTVILMDAPSE
jgi:superkiller protein 3